MLRPALDRRSLVWSGSSTSPHARSARKLVGVTVGTVVCILAGEVYAQSARAEELQADIEILAEGPAGEVASEELTQARALLRLAIEARRSGDDQVSEGLLALVPIQLRLIREILRAVESERAADAAERELEEAERLVRVERENLERALARLLALSVEPVED